MIVPYAMPKRYPAVLGTRKARPRKTEREAKESRSLVSGSRIQIGKRAETTAMPIAAANRPL